MPSSMIHLLKAQAARYRQDYGTAVSMIPSAKSAHQRCHRSAEDSFRYAWCIVNTRCLYFNPAQPSPAIADTPPGKGHDSNQHMVLCPLIDLFNHTSSSDTASTVTHDRSGFTVTSRKAHSSEDEKDSEIFVSYGPHSNDFLLVEYGFIIPDDENIHDSISLDSTILATLCEEQKDMLSDKGYLGEYTLFAPAANGGLASVCWRTEVAARVGVLSRDQWEGFVDGLLNDEDLAADVPAKIVAVIHAWVGEVKGEVERSVRTLQNMGGGDPGWLLAVFGDDVKTEEACGNARPISNLNRSPDDEALSAIESDPNTRIAKQRHNLVLGRCIQIRHICHAFLSPDGS